MSGDNHNQADPLNLDAIEIAIRDDLETLGKPQTFEPGREHWRAAKALQGNADALVAEVRRLRDALDVIAGEDLDYFGRLRLTDAENAIYVIARDALGRKA